ncbi:hypothetical protein MRB53_003291 [Persea americana]|uniref:Uncharacterized protein n=1 Tax=Persea americana TaxID=3435 RepID=A0ACC2MXL5_PERAE|nr:hypothetical protein MRB53_003291 [Persea americana]
MGEEGQTQTKMRVDMAKFMGSTYIITSRSLFTVLSLFLILVGVTSLVVWLVYRPSKPLFTVVSAAVYDMNATSPYVISTTMQFTVVIQNPNKRVAVYYDRLSAFVSYRNQAITVPVPLPPLFQARHGTMTMSPMLGGGFVPVSGEVSSGIVMDEAYGVVGLRLVVLGRVRWKVGAFRSGHYGMYVACDMFMGLKKDYVGQVPLLGFPNCNVDI